MSISRIGEPRRHFARHYSIADGLGPGPGFRIGAERHGRDLARTVAFLASILEDRQDVFVKLGRRLCCAGSKQDPGASERAMPRTYRDTPWSRNERSGLPL